MVKSPPPLLAPKWRRRAEARPEEILDAALDVFTESGFDAARMEDIARRAGISKGGLYLYFDSKQALLKALIESRVAPIAGAIGAVADAGAIDPKAALYALARAIAAKIVDPRNIAVPRLVLSVSQTFPEIAEFYRERVMHVGRSAIGRLIKSGIERGVFRKVDIDAATRAFVGPFVFEALWMHAFHGPTGLRDAEAMIKNQLDILFRGLEQTEQSA